MPKPEVEMLALEAVPELIDVVEIEDPEVELETALPFRDMFELVAAIGAETLFACEASGNGNARVTAGLDPFAGVIGGANGASKGAGGGLNLAVAGEMRTRMSHKELSYVSS